MFALVKAGQVTKEIAGGPYTNDDGVQYPSNIFSVWSKDELKELGIYTIQDDSSVVVDTKVEKLTSEFSYTINEDHVLKTHVKIDLDINVVKTETINSIKLTQNNNLGEYDWCYIRKMDKGTDVPTNVQNYRDAVRTAGDKMITDITAVTDKAGFQALYPVWTPIIFDPDTGEKIEDSKNIGGSLDVWPDPKDYDL
jgi:hypothetical protein